MMALRTWFLGRTRREQWLVAIMMLLAAITLVWAVMILPIRDGLSSSRERHAGAVIRLGETEAMVAAVRRAQRNAPAPLSAPLADTVRARADQAGLALATVDVEANDRVRIAISVARPPALFAWLAALEADGILVASIAVTPNPDRTVAVQATLSARGA